MSLSRVYRHFSQALVLLLAAACQLLTSCGHLDGCKLLPRPQGDSAQARLKDCLARCEQHWAGALDNQPLHRLGYDLACRQTLCELRARISPPGWRQLVAGSAWISDTAPPGEWDVTRFDDIVAANPAGLSKDDAGLASKTLGLPVMAVMKYRAAAAAVAKLFPMHGRNLPGTLVVDCSAPGQPRLRLFDSLQTRAPVLAGKARQLAVDFETPLERALGCGYFGEMFSLPRLFQPQRGLEEIGIYSLTPYRKGAVPVIFIHGLESDPTTWNQAMRAVWADPELAKHYQIWYFLYPTGLPIPESAARLRRALAMTRETYDPQRQDPALDRMILVGHSMGGVLSRWQMVDSGDALWNKFFPGTKPQTLPVSASQRDILQRQLIFTANRSIGQAIFVAAPHRGSKVAQGLGDWVVRFIKLPFDLAGIAVSIATLDQKLLNPTLRAYRQQGQTSLETLRADWPAVQVMDKLKLCAPHHSIIARSKATGPVEGTDDGLVPYASSHLASAQSETMVHAWHSCCRHPAVVQEISRLLRQAMKRPSQP